MKINALLKAINIDFDDIIIEHLLFTFTIFGILLLTDLGGKNYAIDNIVFLY